MSETVDTHPEPNRGDETMAAEDPAPFAPFAPFAAALARLRAARGWTQHRLSVESDVPVSAISTLERGRREPRLSTLARLASALGVGIDELAGREGGR
jgi:ribosome-binding protein aMBF1 (putative translation factor)